MENNSLNSPKEKHGDNLNSNKYKKKIKVTQIDDNITEKSAITNQNLKDIYCFQVLFGYFLSFHFLLLF